MFSSFSQHNKYHNGSSSLSSTVSHDNTGISPLSSSAISEGGGGGRLQRRNSMQISSLAASNSSNNLTSSSVSNFSPNSTMDHSSDYIDVKQDDDDSEISNKPFIFFGIDLTNFPPMFQFMLPTLGLLIFMCLYGYLQELVVYGLFERKWSNLQTFLHFFGVYVCAEVQSIVTSSSRHHSSSNQQSSLVTLGTAPPSVAFAYYFLLSLIKTLTMTFANLSMTRINYPAKTMCKSALPIVTMMVGLLWFRKSYPLRDYLVSILLVAGLYLFICSDTMGSPEGTGLGLTFVGLSLLGSVLTPMCQEYLMDTYNASPEDLIYYSFLGSALLSLIFTFLCNEAILGALFLYHHGSPYMWLCFSVFNACSYLGAACSIVLTARFGSVVNALVNTSRKALTVSLSFAMFPERNTLHMQHIIGAIVFSAGIIVRGIMKGDDHSQKHQPLPLHSMPSSPIPSPPPPPPPPPPLILLPKNGHVNHSTRADDDVYEEDDDFFVATSPRSSRLSWWPPDATPKASIEKEQSSTTTAKKKKKVWRTESFFPPTPESA